MMSRGPNSNFASEAFQSAKAHWSGREYLPKSRRKKSAGTDEQVFSNTRDPKPLSFVLGTTARDLGWKKEIAQAELIENWPEFIGSQTASHTSIVEIRDGVITVQCDSTAWSTELRRLRPEILNRLSREFPEAKITEFTFLGPGAPSWKHGPRSVPGRGPRDTYG